MNVLRKKSSVRLQQIKVIVLSLSHINYFQEKMKLITTSLVTQLMKMANSNVASKVTNFQPSQKLVNYLKHITFLKRNLTPYLKD